MSEEFRDFERDTMTMAELRTRMGVSLTVIYELANRDALPVPVFRLGRQLFVSRRAWENLMNQQHSKDTQQEAGSNAA